MQAVIYSKDNCPYCVEARRLLAVHRITFTEKKLGIDYSRDDLVSLLPEERRKEKLTVPQIWLYGRYIGGCDDLQEHFENVTGLNDYML